MDRLSPHEELLYKIDAIVTRDGRKALDSDVVKRSCGVLYSPEELAAINSGEKAGDDLFLSLRFWIAAGKNELDVMHHIFAGHHVGVSANIGCGERTAFDWAMHHKNIYMGRYLVKRGAVPFKWTVDSRKFRSSVDDVADSAAEELIKVDNYFKKVNGDSTKWSISDVKNWVLNITKDAGAAAAFEREEVNGYCLFIFSLDDLKQILKSDKHVELIWKNIEAIRPRR